MLFCPETNIETRMRSVFSVLRQTRAFRAMPRYTEAHQNPKGPGDARPHRSANSSRWRIDRQTSGKAYFYHWSLFWHWNWWALDAHVKARFSTRCVLPRTYGVTYLYFAKVRGNLLSLVISDFTRNFSDRPRVKLLCGVTTYMNTIKLSVEGLHSKVLISSVTQVALHLANIWVYAVRFSTASTIKLVFEAI